MSLPRLYVETTVRSYLVARSSRDVILAGHQETTRLWWEKKRGDYDLYVSELVLEETAAGDPAMAAARHAALAGLRQLVQTPAVDALAARILEQGIIPPSAAPDAEHIALAAVHAMNFLLTWNCSRRWICRRWIGRRLMRSRRMKS